MPRGKIWNKDKVWEFKEMYEDPDYSLEDIATHFNMKVNSVYSTAWKYKFKRNFYYEEGYLRCMKCKAILPIEEFHKNKASYSGRQSKCKDCCSREHPTQRNVKSYTTAEKDFIIKNYSNTKYTTKDLAKHLGINDQQLKNIVSRLRKKGIEIKYRNKKG